MLKRGWNVVKNLFLVTVMVSALSCTGMLLAQSATTAGVLNPTVTTSDPAALAILATAMQALGGSAAVGQVDSCTLTGTTKMHSGNTYATTWLDVGSQYRIEVSGSSGSYYVVSNNGLPVKVVNGQKAYLPSSSEIEGIAHLPARVLLDHLSDPLLVATMSSLSAVSDQQPSEANAQVVRFTSKSRAGSHVIYEDWLLNPNTHLPISVHFEVRSQAGYGPGIRFAAYYGQYKSVQNATLPMTTIVTMGGHFLYGISINSFVCGQAIAQSSFQP